MINKKLFIAFLAVATAVASFTTLAKSPASGGPYYPSSNAVDIVTTYTVYQENLNHRGAKNGESGNPPEPPQVPSPGDTRSEEWTVCSTENCTRYRRTDRWQRGDAPISGDPDDGVDQYDWIPTSWGSISCETFNACLRAFIHLDPR